MTAHYAALVYCFFTGVVALFQLALAMGMPWGGIAMGGRFPGRFPPPMRIAALVQMALLSVTGLVVATRAGIVLPQWHLASEIAVWAVVALGGLGLVMNLITPVRMERLIWAPVAAILLVSSVVVASS